MTIETTDPGVTFVTDQAASIIRTSILGGENSLQAASRGVRFIQQHYAPLNLEEFVRTFAACRFFAERVRGGEELS